jgi:hypothetical protein
MQISCHHHIHVWIIFQVYSGLHCCYLCMYALSHIFTNISRLYTNSTCIKQSATLWGFFLPKFNVVRIMLINLGASFICVFKRACCFFFLSVGQVDLKFASLVMCLPYFNSEIICFEGTQLFYY